MYLEQSVQVCRYVVCLLEIFGGSVDWFKSVQTTTTTANAGSSSAWTNYNTDVVSNGHIDVWPTLTSSGISY